MPHYKLLIDGEYVDTPEHYDVLSPADGKTVATVAKGGVEHVDLAVAAAERAFRRSGWRETPSAQRAEVIAKAADEIGRRSAELSMLSAQENGTPVRLAGGLSVGFPILHMQYFAQLAREFVADRTAYVNGSVTGVIRNEPIGVVAGIIPWNFPLLIAVWKTIPAILAGNSVVLKVAEKTPPTAFVLAEILTDCGLPAGVFNIITGDGATVGGHLTGHPRVRKISFTGSTATGRTVMRNAAANVKQVTLELGGKGANIVLPDADLDLAIDGTLWGFLLHAGQACEAGTRLFVHTTVYDEFVERLVKRAAELTVGDPTDPATDIGPVVNAAQRSRIESLIDSAVREGAKLEYQGKLADSADEAGHFVPPTIFTDVEPSMRVAAEEVFGPVLSVMRFDDVDAVIDEANNTEYGLSAGVWSRDIAEATEIAGRLESGTVWINDWHNLPGTLPFGGYKQSGIGREMGPNARLAHPAVPLVETGEEPSDGVLLGAVEHRRQLVVAADVGVVGVRCLYRRRLGVVRRQSRFTGENDQPTVGQTATGVDRNRVAFWNARNKHRSSSRAPSTIRDSISFTAPAISGLNRGSVVKPADVMSSTPSMRRVRGWRIGCP